MMNFKILLLAAVIMSARARYLILEDDNNYFVMPVHALQGEEAGEIVAEDLEYHEETPVGLGRVRRQVHGSATTNSDGTHQVNVKMPLATGEKNMISAVGGLNFVPGNGGLKPAGQTAGLALDNINGHGLTLTHTHMPNADAVAAAAKVNLFHNDNHNLDAKAYVARTMPADSRYSNFNTYGGGADYMFKDKIGAGMKISHTPLFDKTDYSGYGTLNVFRGRDSSLDFNAGLSKSVSPYIPSSRWEPNAGLSFTKWF